jgi:hypothetical protein
MTANFFRNRRCGSRVIAQHLIAAILIFAYFQKSICYAMS